MTFPEETEADTKARWWHNQLIGLIAELESLRDPATGLASANGISAQRGWSVPRRLAFARRLEEGFAPGAEIALRWEVALPGINSTYPGLELSMQIGLVPIGADADSGLWEFWHMQTGAEPQRGRDGRLVMAEESGLVFVLLPSGRFRMGAQTRDPRGSNYDPEAEGREGPVHEVRLSAFFLSKFELTQEQWERAAGTNPSRWTAELPISWIPGAHPVEQVSWLDCVVLLPTMGLELPSEAQWEYGCRAGTNTPRPFGYEQFATHMNIGEQAFEREFVGVIKPEAWDDGLSGVAPIGSLLPNAFGLHDVLGNVWEWCLDDYDEGFYDTSPLKDPVSGHGDSETRVTRGGSFSNSAIHARSSNRYGSAPASTDDNIGVRPARVITD